MNDFSMLGNLFFRNALILKKPFDIYKPKELYEKDHYLCRTIIKSHLLLYPSLEEEYNKHKEHLKVKIKSPTIQISYSSLGKTEFTDCPLGDFRFEFNNSKITDCFVSGGTLPANNVHIIDAEPNSLKEYQQKASFFNQFKKIFEAQGDIYHATQFQAKWAEEQRKELRFRHKQEYARAQIPVWWSKIKIFFNATSNDRFTLWLNKKSNLHGENYLKALAFTLISALVFYLIYLCTIQRLYLGGKFDPNLLGYYFEYLNPAHRLNFIEGNEIINGGTIATDFFGRVFVSYGIYQFIAAFRKHTKKQ